jgi:D-alanyl-lipoteichoic acid acyltransferase DltB (MBOAT superfamily)
MSFLSSTFFLWFIVTFAFSWLSPRRIQHLAIAISSAVFLLYHSPLSLFVLLSSSIIIYFCLQSATERATLAVVCIFLVSTVLIGFRLKTALNPALGVFVPLGISYYSLRHIHYILESLKKKLKPHGLIDYLCYQFFLPTLSVGPIHRFPDFLRDLQRRRWDTAKVSRGIERMINGYAKLVLLANYAAAIKMKALIVPLAKTHHLLFIYLKSVLDWLVLYFQFSGYSDIAIGFSLMMGFRVMENFNYPMLASNIKEFWQRWHISLTGWCKDYIFMPIAALTRRPFIAILAAMIILGLWHEFSGRYILWGIYHGVGIAIWHQFQKVKRKYGWENRGWKPLTRTLSVLMTLNFVILSFIITKIVYAKILILLRM